jgi:hypothetical protein
MTKQKALGTKKATTPKSTSSKPQVVTKRRTNFDLVAVGVCPHDNEKLGNEIRGSGVGVTRTCEKCAHVWYINTKIKTCKCLSCSVERRKAFQHVSSSSSGEVVGHCGLEPQTSVLSGLRSNQLS